MKQLGHVTKCKYLVSKEEIHDTGKKAQNDITKLWSLCKGGTGFTLLHHNFQVGLQFLRMSFYILDAPVPINIQYEDA